MRIILDAFGGDNAPLEILKGAALAVKEYGHTVLLAGREEEIRRVAAENGISLEGMDIADAPGIIGMDDEPKSILKEHKDCSMAEGLRRLAAGEGDALVSAGSTGALIMGATFLVKRIKGVSRAALAALVPSDKGPFMLIDSGANVDCRPEMLLQFAHMGSLYMTRVMNNGTPATVGLLNVGTEDHKGGETQREIFALLKDSGLNFVGNIEARQVPMGAVDVLAIDRDRVAVRSAKENIVLNHVENAVRAVEGDLLSGQQQMQALDAPLRRRGGGGLFLRGRGDLKGDGDDEGGAHPHLAGHFNGPAHLVHQALHDGHAQAGALIDAAGVVFLLGKGLEDALQKLLAHAHAGVRDGPAVGDGVAV